MYKLEIIQSCRILKCSIFNVFFFFFFFFKRNKNNPSTIVQLSDSNFKSHEILKDFGLGNNCTSWKYQKMILDARVLTQILWVFFL